MLLLKILMKWKTYMVHSIISILIILSLSTSKNTKTKKSSNSYKKRKCKCQILPANSVRTVGRDFLEYIITVVQKVVRPHKIPVKKVMMNPEVMERERHHISMSMNLLHHAISQEKMKIYQNYLPVRAPWMMEH